MERMVIVSCILATWFAISNCAILLDEYEYEIQNAPSMAPFNNDCSVIIYDMSDCVSFLSDGSTDTEPDHACCSGLETVVETNADCVCEAFMMNSQMGIQLNITRALALPAACGVSAPPLDHCHIPQPPQSSLSNGNPPELSPNTAPSSPSISEPPTSASETLAPSPSPNKGGGGTAAHAPAPSPAPQIGIPSLLLASFVVCVSICLFLV